MCARILVVDDDPVNLDLMTYLLGAFGHEPVAADDAVVALNLTHKEMFDLILCDIQMPGVDGFEFLRRLKPETRKGTPVIGITALAMVGDREKIMAAGFDGYMAKPIAPETFVQEIERFVAAPQNAATPVTGRTTESVAAAPRPAAGPRRNVRVLVVDNEPANLEILRIHLDHAGYDVITARSGNRALQIAQSEIPSVIVSDLHMPDGDGFALLRSVRQNPRLRDTPVIFVSATTQGRADVDRGIALGAYQFLVRPFEPELLLDAVAQCLSGAERKQ